MSIIQAVYDRLIGDEILEGLLAVSPLEGGGPAIFDSWIHEATPLPCVSLRWSFNTSYHWGRQSSPLAVDIWTEGSTTLEAEGIRNRIIELLDREHLSSEEAGPVRIYLNNDMVVPEDTPGITHWTLEFEVVWWRKAFVGHLLNEGGC